MIVFVFPGQGSQAKGMGKALADAYPAARQVFEEADEALGMSLSRLCFEGPDEELKRTEITQPAILTTSMAARAALLAERPELTPAFVAGHSLGEFSALVACGALRFADAVRVVRERGRLMQDAVPLGVGAMAAVLGLAPEKVGEVVAQTQAELTSGRVSVANYNSTEQVVISGHKEAVEAASKALTAAGASKIMALPVSAPFHSPLMQKAAEGLAAVLAPVPVSAPAYPVVTNVTAAPNQDPARVKGLLVEQVTAPVRWVEIVRYLASAGVTQAIEIGPGKVLTGLNRRIEKNIKGANVEDPVSLKKTLEALAAPPV